MLKIPENWSKILNEEIEKKYFIDLIECIENEYINKAIYPLKSDIFKALEYCSFNDIKVVLLGQDPYHGEGQAHGLCFSVNEGIKQPPSLKNVFKEIKSDIGKDIPETGNLLHWAKQGILMLNSVMTVKASTPGSHRNKGWEIFTNEIIKKISENKKNIVFLLWGNYAKEKKNLIDINKNKILEAAHPSPFSAYSGFFGCKHFSKTNKYLKENGISEIEW